MKNSKIKERRIELGLTQKEVAEKAGISTATMSYYERNFNRKETDNLLKIREILQIPTVRTNNKPKIINTLEKYSTKELINELQKRFAG